MHRRKVAAISLTIAVCTWACGSSRVGGSSDSGSSSPSAPTSTSSPSADVTWSYNGSAWQASGTPPPCGDPLLLNAPLDVSAVTSVLYPGQSRPDYKSHGGFRLDGPGQTNDVQVTAAQSGYVYRGTRYLVSGEVQYEFDIINPCGVMHRLGHLRQLSSRFSALADLLPPPVEGDSHTTNLPSGYTVAAGEVVATAIGLRATSNVFMDFGVYDLRHKNAASSDPGWAAAHPGELDQYGICWLDNLAGGGSLRSLPPGDPQAGRTSDYCR